MAGNGVFQTDFEGMDLMANRLQEKLDLARLELSAMKQDIEKVNAAWSGTAHDKYVETLYAQEEELSRVIEDLQTYVYDLRRAGKEYAQTDSEVQNMINTLL